MQVGELGHAPVSLASRARPIQRKSIDSFSTIFSTGRGARALLLALALAAVAGACAGGEPGMVPSDASLLTADPETLQVDPNGTGTLRFVLTSGSVLPIAGQTVSFTIVDNPYVEGVEAQGARLSVASGTTDRSGAVTVQVLAGRETRFDVRAQAGSAEAMVNVDVVAGQVGSIIVAPYFDPGSRFAVDPDGAGINTILVRFFDRTQCREHSLVHVPTTVRTEMLPAKGGTARFDSVSTTQPSAIFAEAQGDLGTPVAVGCVDLPGASVLPNGLVEVALPLYDAVPDPSSAFAVTSTFDFDPPLAAAAAIAAPWRDLSDCPLDPAQLLLDCTIDALSLATPGDPLDCRPSPIPGAEGPLGDALLARRGDLLPATECRGPRSADMGISLDAIAMGLFGAPKPALIAALPAISEDAAHVLDAPMLFSTLDVRPGAEADHYLIAHTLTGAHFALPGGGEADVPLTPLALPNVTAYTEAITRDGLLVVDRHGFSLRLGRVARAGFGAAALVPRRSPGTAGGLVAAIAALASTDEGLVTGCAAFDRVLCAVVDAPPGCLAAACPAGLTMLAAQLDKAFDAADGAGLDLYLSGSAPLIDTNMDSWADLLATSADGIAAWSAEVRTNLGVARMTAELTGRTAGAQ
jgi:hypothetical protein